MSLAKLALTLPSNTVEVGERLIKQAQVIIEAADKFSDIAEGSRHQLDTSLKVGGIYTVATVVVVTNF